MRTLLLAEPCPPQFSGGNSLKPRIGFLGADRIARHRLESIARSGVADIAAVADPERALALQAARNSPRAAILSSFDALLEVELDGVVMATPSALHAEQAVAALERGVAVFCHKPLGRNAAEARRVTDAARAAGLLLGVDLPYRFLTAARKIRELCRDGELGDVYNVDLVFHNAFGPDKWWAYDWQVAGGGCLIDLGIQLLDLALWTLEFPRVINATSRLFARGNPISGRSHEAEDHAIARLDLETGATISLACSWRLPSGCDASISGSFYGTRGGARFHNVDGSFHDYIAERFTGTKRETLACSPELWGGRAAVDWAQRLADGAKFDADVDHLVGVAAALDAIYESSGSIATRTETSSPCHTA
jgi:predicted dehydrogenase